MDLNAQKEMFSDAYLMAVAAVAGFAADKPSRDNDSVDWMISSDGALGTSTHPRLDVQLKSTSEHSFDDTFVTYKLKLKNYNDLRIQRIYVPRILVVVILPKAFEEALQQTEEEMTLRRCAYWLDLKGYEETSNSAPVTIKLPRQQMFTPDALRNLMVQIDKEAP